MKKLTLGSFKREGARGSFGHTFTHHTDDGREVCLESCFSGYCVGIFDKDKIELAQKISLLEKLLLLFVPTKRVENEESISYWKVLNGKYYCLDIEIK